jgi:hypothetical protein
MGEFPEHPEPNAVEFRDVRIISTIHHRRKTRTSFRRYAVTQTLTVRTDVLLRRTRIRIRGVTLSFEGGGTA